MIGGAYQIRIPADSVPNGTNTVSLRGTLADGNSIVTPSAGSVTKSSGSGGSGGGSGQQDEQQQGDNNQQQQGDDGGSSGGCDAGFGALSMAIAAAFLLRKKD